MDRIRILIADNHPKLRAWLRQLLAAIDDLNVVGEATDGFIALEMVDQLKPDLLLTDYSMPGVDGLGLTTTLATGLSSTRVLVFSFHTERAYADRVIRAGASGYLVKGASAAEVEQAVRTAVRGEIHISPAVSKPNTLTDNRANRPEATTNLHQLTSRQRETLKLIAGGQTIEIIARRLDVSVRTVEMLRIQIMERLGLENLSELLEYAIRTGPVQGDA